MFGFFKKKETAEEKKKEPIGPWCVLNNDYKVPRLSVNLDNIPKEQMVQYVTEALQAGYRMFDFENENVAIEEIAQAVENSGIHRNQIFYSVSIKCPEGPRLVDKLVEELLGKLKTNYIDICVFKANGFFGVILELYYYFYKMYSEKKKFKAFGIEGLDTLREDIFNMYRKEKIQLEKISCNLLQPNYVLQTKYDAKKITIMAEESLGTGENLVNYCRVHLEKMAEETGMSISQIALRFLYQRGNIVTIKANTMQELQEYFAIQNFVLTDEQMEYLSQVDNF